MKISKETIEIIDSIMKINNGSIVQGACFQQGNVIKAKRNKGQMPIMKATIEEEFPRDFAIYNLRKFLSMFSLFDDPDLEFSDTHVTFKSGRKKASIKYAEPILIESDQKFYDMEVKMPSKDFSFELSKENYNAIKQAANNFEAPEVALISDGSGEVKLSTYNSLNPNNDSFSIEVGESHDSFLLIMNLDNFSIFPKRDWIVTASYRKLIEFNSGDLFYWFTCTDKSRVN